jgi:biotin carboxyl carrier protein
MSVKSKHPPDVTRRDDLERLMAFEDDIRAARSRLELAHHLTHALSDLFGAQQAFTFQAKGAKIRVTGASHVPDVSREGALIQQIETTLAGLDHTRRNSAMRVSMPKPAQGAAPMPFGAVMPIAANLRDMPDGVLLARAKPWSDQDLGWLHRLSGVYAHAARRADPRRSPWARRVIKTTLWIGVVCVLAALVLVRTPINTIAPARVQPAEPWTVAVGVDGQIIELAVQDGDMVQQGQVIARIEDSAARATLAEMQQAYVVSQVRVAQLQTSATLSLDARQDLQVAQAELELAQITLDDAQAKLDLHSLLAPRAGLIYAGTLHELAGQSVRFGDTIAQIVQPGKVEVLADVAVGDSAFVYDLEGARLFLNNAPLAPHDLAFVAAAYAPQQDPRGSVSYSLRMRFVEEGQTPPLGAEGVVQLQGRDAPLGYVLFRRPLTWIVARLPDVLWRPLKALLP